MLSDARLQIDRLATRQKRLKEKLEPERINRYLRFYSTFVPRALDAELCSVFIYSPKDHKVWLKTSSDVSEHGIEVPIEGSVVGDVIASGKPMIARDLTEKNGAHRVADRTTGFVTREILCVPVLNQERGEVTGAVQVLNKKSGHFNDDDLRLVEEVAEHIQGQVDQVFLSQQVFGDTEKVIKIAKRSIMVALAAFWIVIVGVVGLFAAYALIPLFGA